MWKKYISGMRRNMRRESGMNREYQQRSRLIGLMCLYDYIIDMLLWNEQMLLLAYYWKIVY